MSDVCAWGAWGSYVNACDQDAETERDGTPYCELHASYWDATP